MIGRKNKASEGYNNWAGDTQFKGFKLCFAAIFYSFYSLHPYKDNVLFDMFHDCRISAALSRIPCADIQRDSNIISGSRNTVTAAYTSSQRLLRGLLDGRADIRGGLFTGFLIKLQNVIIYRIHFSTFEGAFISGGRLIIFSFTSRWAYNWWPL